MKVLGVGGLAAVLAASAQFLSPGLKPDRSASAVAGWTTIAEGPQQGAANVRAFGAKGDGVSDDTAAIQAALDKSARVYIPAGIYRVDARIGLIIRDGTEILGEGRTRSILLAKPGGATLAELARYGGGSVIRRRFDPNGRNLYVNYVHLADFAVVLNHPADRVSRDGIQIGIDLRNVTRSLVERVHVGNMPPEGARITRNYDRRYYSQGYGIVLGTVPSSYDSYAGGEVNTIRDTSVWGAYKLIVEDDTELSPRSAAHGVVIEACDLQGGHNLLSQESRYARGVSWRDNILQNVIPQPERQEPSGVLRMDGGYNLIDGGYIEASGSGDYLAQFGPESAHNMVRLPYASATNAAKVSDRGKENSVDIRGSYVK